MTVPHRLAPAAFLVAHSSGPAAALASASVPGALHTPAQPGALTLHWATESATQAFAQRWAQHPGLGNALITLHGDLGAGKTTLVRHLLRALGVSGRVKSPTYAVVEPYEVPWPWALTEGTGTDTGTDATRQPDHPLAIWHFDFYRLGDPREWEDAGLRDLLASPGLKLVEWPDKAGPGMPTPDLALHLHTDTHTDADGDSRRAELVAHTAHGQRCLADLSGPPPPPTEALA